MYSNICQALYGNKSITQLELVHKIKHSLQELHDTARSFPTPLVLDFGKPLQWATRTGASLYLMLFQVSLVLEPTLVATCSSLRKRLSFFVHDQSSCRGLDW